MNHVLEFFEQTVRRFPQKKAVGYEDKSYTFAELKNLSARLGSSIRRALPESAKNRPVAVMADRSADTAVFFLAVLYSGNYYIPIDQEMPADRIRTELADSEAAVLLCEEKYEGLPGQLGFAGTALHMSDMDEQEAELPQTCESDPIYMVYTSGSTGKPKGVLKSHGAVVSFITAFADAFDLTDREIIGNQTPFFYDASAKDFYLMACTGATMEIIPSEKFIFPLRLIEYLNEKQVTYICWVPTALAIVVQLKTFSRILPATLRNVFFVGETFPIKQLGVWIKTLPQIRYVNLYGSTEIAGICCYYETDTRREYDVLPVGKALANCDVFLMEDGRIRCGPGESGEICVAGPALALGYYKDPEKTAAVFLDMVFPDGARRWVLKTGDHARYDQEGNLVFVNRKDFQIKHMGRRIELGEIEAAADSVRFIRRCCCMYQERKKKIYLFCELAAGCDRTKREILSALRQKIPDYMLPSGVVILESMPINANGKIDRAALGQTMK